MFSNQNTPRFQNTLQNPSPNTSFGNNFLNQSQNTPTLFNQSQNTLSSNTPSVFGNQEFGNQQSNPTNPSSGLFASTTTTQTGLFSTNQTGFNTQPNSTLNTFNSSAQPASTGLFGNQSSGQTQTGFGQSPFRPQNSGQSLFGTSTTTTFNQPASSTTPSFGQPTSQSLFGNQTSQPSLFGQTSQPAFGQNTGSTFGQNTTSGFGLSTASAFGQSTGSTFGQNTSSAFGQTTQQPFSSSSQPSFGQPSQSTFGQPNTSTFGQNTQSVFGQPTTSTFGQNTQSAFGQSSITSFGQQSQPSVNQPSQSMFGSTQQSSFNQPSKPLFGATSQSSFGATNQPSLGSTSMFGSSQPQNPSQPSFFPSSNATSSSLGTFGQSTSLQKPTQGFSATTFNQPQTQQASTYLGFQTQSTSGGLFSSQPSMFSATPSTANNPTTNFSLSSNQPSLNIQGSQTQFPSTQSSNLFGTPQTSSFTPFTNQQTTNLFNQTPTINPPTSTFGSTPSIGIQPAPSNSWALVPVPQPVCQASASQFNSVDKEITLFGYKQNALRYGNLDYYNSDYSKPINSASVVESSFEIIKNEPSNSAMIESFSQSSSEFDLKLGAFENPNSHTVLSNPPLDTITRVRFSRSNSNFLAAASWDGSVKIWKIDTNLINNQFVHSFNINGCVLDLDWNKDDRLILGSSDGSVSVMDVNTRAGDMIGTHTGPVKAVNYCGDDQPHIILSASYDGYVKCWDIRSKTAAFSQNTSSKVIDLEFHNNNVSFINNKQEMFVYNFNNPLSLKYNKEFSKLAPLRSLAMTHFIAARPTDVAIAVGTVNGRIFFESISKTQKCYSFRTNRQTSGLRMNEQIAYPVHDLQFNQKSKVLATGGGDGVINVWDVQHSRSVYCSKQMNLPITSISYNNGSDLMAYAVGYDWSRGIKHYKYQTQRPQIFLRYSKEEYSYYGSRTY